MSSINHLFNIKYLRSVLLYYNFKFIPFVFASRVTKPNLNFACLVYGLAWKTVYSLWYFSGEFRQYPRKVSFRTAKLFYICQAVYFREGWNPNLYRSRRLKSVFISVHCCLSYIMCIYSYYYFFDPCKTNLESILF